MFEEIEDFLGIGKKKKKQPQFEKSEAEKIRDARVEAQTEAIKLGLDEPPKQTNYLPYVAVGLVIIVFLFFLKKSTKK